MCLLVCLYVNPSGCQVSVCLFVWVCVVCVFVRLSVCLLVCAAVRFFVCLFAWLYVYVSTYLRDCLLVGERVCDCLCVCLFVCACLFVCLFGRLIDWLFVCPCCMFVCLVDGVFVCGVCVLVFVLVFFDFLLVYQSVGLLIR